MSEATSKADPRLLKGDAYRLDGAARPWLKGVRCARGHVGFPFQTFGCERCGALQLEPVDLAARGVIAASAVVPIVLSQGPPPPFAVAAIRLDDGPMVRALLENLDGAPGEVVEGVMVELAPGDADAAMDLRFRRIAVEGAPA